MSSPAVDPLRWYDHDSEPEPELEIVPPPLPVADPDSDYEPAVVRSPPPPLPVHVQPPRGQVRGRPRGRARGRPRGRARGLPRVQGQGHAPAPAQLLMRPAFNCARIPYNDAWLPHKLSEYGLFVCSFCHAKHWVEEKQQSSTNNNPMYTLCCHAGKVGSIGIWASRLLY